MERSVGHLANISMKTYTIHLICIIIFPCSITPSFSIILHHPSTLCNLALLAVLWSTAVLTCWGGSANPNNSSLPGSPAHVHTARGARTHALPTRTVGCGLCVCTVGRTAVYTIGCEHSYSEPSFIHTAFQHLSILKINLNYMWTIYFI